MRDRAAERRRARTLGVDVDEVVIVGHVGERVHPLLRHLAPVGRGRARCRRAPAVPRGRSRSPLCVAVHAASIAAFHSVTDARAESRTSGRGCGGADGAAAHRFERAPLRFAAMRLARLCDRHGRARAGVAAARRRADLVAACTLRHLRPGGRPEGRVPLQRPSDAQRPRRDPRGSAARRSCGRCDRRAARRSTRRRCTPTTCRRRAAVVGRLRLGSAPLGSPPRTAAGQIVAAVGGRRRAPRRRRGRSPGPLAAGARRRSAGPPRSSRPPTATSATPTSSAPRPARRRTADRAARAAPLRELVRSGRSASRGARRRSPR